MTAIPARRAFALARARPWLMTLCALVPPYEARAQSADTMHEYRVRGGTQDALTMEVEPGETYYVRASISMGFMAGRPNLAPSDETTFPSMSKKLKPAK